MGQVQALSMQFLYETADVQTLRFDDGTLIINDADLNLIGEYVVWDARIKQHRAQAMAYEPIVRALHGKSEYTDEVKQYQSLSLKEDKPLAMRPYQRQSLARWLDHKKRGVIVLPTGAGKTYVAVQAILAAQRSTIILAPTIDLVQQWAADLEARLQVPIGQYGGGEKNLQDITVATYDSGILIMPHYGDRFGLLICDECHHLPSDMTSLVAEACIAPFRLGLSATPERTDGQHGRLEELLGPIVHRSDITELEGEYLANYQAEVLEIAMDEDEFAAYNANRQIYLDFVRSEHINFSSPDGWQQFISKAARSANGRAVMTAYREQKRLARASQAKLRVCWELIQDHRDERIIVFTDDNATAYELGRRMVFPVLTHNTKSAERKHMLNQFRSGVWPVLVTSRVLNEGVDVPEASVGIVVSGSGTVREHVQRLGRILRPAQGKVAILYELISAGTAESYTSERRRSHVAFGQQEQDFEDAE